MGEQERLIYRDALRYIAETGCWIPGGCESEGEPCLPCAARRALVLGAKLREAGRD